MEIIPGGVTAAKGFLAAHAAAGIKYRDKDRPDMALIVSEAPAQLAGTFTKNIVQAAPVRWDRALVDDGTAVRAILVNAGIANACNGRQGDEDCEKSAALAAATLGFTPKEVCVASTGVIGQPLPMERIERGIGILSKSLSGSVEAGTQAAQAILTTDTKKKEAAVRIRIGDTNVSIGGMAKGSGMIHPNMGTMLSFVTTDAAITKELLQEALSETVEDTYNMISVDGDTSTNDTCLVLANGCAKNPPITKKGEDFQVFKEALYAVNLALARMMAGDGEGATALFETKVIHAADRASAKTLARSVISSNLTKAAIFGHDANWGRILCALGYAGADFDPEKVDIHIESQNGSLMLVRDGIAVSYSEEQASGILSAEEVTVVCDMKQGEAQASAYGCDLTYDYVKINADYRS